jgi:hypothetical protein
MIANLKNRIGKLADLFGKDGECPACRGRKVVDNRYSRDFGSDRREELLGPRPQPCDVCGKMPEFIELEDVVVHSHAEAVASMTLSNESEMSVEERAEAERRALAAVQDHASH